MKKNKHLDCYTKKAYNLLKYGTVFVSACTLMISVSACASVPAENEVSEVEAVINIDNEVEVSEDTEGAIESSEASQVIPEPITDDDVNVITINSQYIPLWNTQLFNYENPVPDTYVSSLVSLDNGEDVDVRIYPELVAMISDARAEGITLTVVSGYRSYDTQTVILDNGISNRMANGMSYDEARADALMSIALPGHSEHQVGLAVDFNDISTSFMYTDAYAWLAENAEKYGFIERYKEDKMDITKIEHEPWHYRYVGAESAMEMNDLGLCLEEYVEYQEASHEEFLAIIKTGELDTEDMKYVITDENGAVG